MYYPVLPHIWKEPYDSGKHHVVPIDYWCNAHDRVRALGLISKDVVAVHVAPSTFQFMSVRQLRDCLSIFEQNIHPSSRHQMPAETLAGIHGQAQRWFERLPMHLLEEANRRKVVEALSRASQLIDEDKL